MVIENPGLFEALSGMRTGDVPAGAGASNTAWFSKRTTRRGVRCPAIVGVGQQVPIRPPCVNDRTNTAHCQTHCC